MSSIISEPLVIGYTCCGPTFRKSVYDKLKNYYFDDDNLFYCIVTDDKSYFNDLNRKNLIVNELKDFYDEFPLLEQNEYFLESTNEQDYANKFIQNEYRFPFSTYRFNIWQALKLKIKNVSMLCTDTTIKISSLPLDIMLKPNTFYNARSAWFYNYDKEFNIQSFITYKDTKPIVNFLENKFNKKIDDNILVLDEAARLYIPNTLKELKHLFQVWNDVIEFLYKTKQINQYKGSYVIHDEFILAPIYNLLNINFNNSLDLFEVNHNTKVERFWM
jgi:hypothetical protein